MIEDILVNDDVDDDIFHADHFANQSNLEPFQVDLSETLIVTVSEMNANTKISPV